MDFINFSLDLAAACSVAGIYLAALYIPRTKTRRALVSSILMPVMSAMLAGIASYYVVHIFR